MKYYIFLFVYISVASAMKVVSMDSETSSKPPPPPTPSSPPPPPPPPSPPKPEPRKEPDFFSPFSPEEPVMVEERQFPRFFDLAPSFSSVFRNIHDSMQRFIGGLMSPFREFPRIFGDRSEPDRETALFDEAPLEPVFDVASHLDDSEMNKYPPNYFNSTSKIHHSKDSNMMVNQTVRKQSGDGFNNFMSVKTFQLMPKALVEENKEGIEGRAGGGGGEEEGIEGRAGREEEKEGVEGDVKDQLIANAEQIKKLPKSADRQNEVDYDDTDLKASKGDLNDADVEPKEDFKGEKFNRPKREIGQQLPGSTSVGGKKAIVFPASHLNRFPQSFRNNKNIRTDDLKERSPVSKSYVYKNIGGKTTMYIVDHSPKSKSGALTATPNVGGVRPPDLSRDTKVNPSGDDDHQQSLTLVDPDAVVFDLDLVAKEIESRPKDK